MAVPEIKKDDLLVRTAATGADVLGLMGVNTGDIAKCSGDMTGAVHIGYCRLDPGCIHLLRPKGKSCGYGGELVSSSHPIRSKSIFKYSPYRGYEACATG